jgi:hypothetical protein
VERGSSTKSLQQEGAWFRQGNESLEGLQCWGLTGEAGNQKRPDHAGPCQLR